MDDENQGLFLPKQATSDSASLAKALKES